MFPAICWRPTGRRKTKSHEGGRAHWLQKVRFPGRVRPSVDRRGGIYPARGRLRRAGAGGMRASRPTNARVVAVVRFRGSFRKVCRGGPWPSRERPRHRRVPGTISGLRAGPAARLAPETRLRAQCKHRPLQRFVVTGGRGFLGWPPHFPYSVGRAFTPAEPMNFKKRWRLRFEFAKVRRAKSPALQTRPKPNGRARHKRRS